MRDIGQFYVISVEGVTRADGTLLQVTRIDCSCIKCSWQFRAIPNHGLVDLDGAAALSCPTSVAPSPADSVPCLLLPFPSVPAGTRFLSASAHHENWLFNCNDKTLPAVWM